MVERSLSMREGPGSMPGTSTLQQTVAILFSPNKLTTPIHILTRITLHIQTLTDTTRDVQSENVIFQTITESPVASRLYVLLAQYHHPTPMSSAYIESNSCGQTLTYPITYRPIQVEIRDQFKSPSHFKPLHYFHAHILNTYIYICIYIHMYVCVCVCVCVQMICSV